MVAIDDKSDASRRCVAMSSTVSLSHAQHAGSEESKGMRSAKCSIRAKVVSHTGVHERRASVEDPCIPRFSYMHHGCTRADQHLNNRDWRAFGFEDTVASVGWLVTCTTRRSALKCAPLGGLHGSGHRYEAQRRASSIEHVWQREIGVILVRVYHTCWLVIPRGRNDRSNIGAVSSQSQVLNSNQVSMIQPCVYC
jgi:hypothetical protein